MARWKFRSALLLLVTAACGSRDTPTSPSATPTPIRRVVVLGDSLAVSPSIEDSFPSQLQARVEAQRLRWTVVNAGVNGDTTVDGLRRLDPLLTGDAGVLVVELGANDGLKGVAVSTIEQNLLAIVQRARERNVRPLLCGMETPPTYGYSRAAAVRSARSFSARGGRAGSRSQRTGPRAPECGRRAPHCRNRMDVSGADASELIFSLVTSIVSSSRRYPSAGHRMSQMKTAGTGVLVASIPRLRLHQCHAEMARSASAGFRMSRCSF